MSARVSATLDRNVIARSLSTQLLHLAVAVSVVHQLLISQIMQPPTATAVHPALERRSAYCSVVLRVAA